MSSWPDKDICREIDNVYQVTCNNALICEVTDKIDYLCLIQVAHITDMNHCSTFGRVLESVTKRLCVQIPPSAQCCVMEQHFISFFGLALYWFNTGKRSDWLMNCWLEHKASIEEKHIVYITYITLWWKYKKIITILHSITGLQISVCNQKIIFLFLYQNMCCGYSKELSQWDGSFEHPKHMLTLTAKKIFTIVRSKCLPIWTHALSYICTNHLTVKSAPTNSLKLRLTSRPTEFKVMRVTCDYLAEQGIRNKVPY